MRRRKFLAGASVGFVVSVSGCLDSTSLVEQTESRDKTDERAFDDGTNEDTSDDEMNDDEYEYEAVEGKHEFDGGTFTIKQFRGNWNGLHDVKHDSLVYFADAQRALNYFDGDPLTEELQTFVTETDFSQERLLFLSSWGENPGYSEVMIRSVSLTDKTLVGRAAAYAETSYGADAGRSPAAFIRVTFDEEPVETAEFTSVEGQTPSGGEDKHIGGGKEVTREASTQNE